MESLLTTEEVAEFFRVDVVTVRRMINKGELTAYRVGGEYRFARGHIEEYLERQRLPARADGQGKLGGLARRARKLTPAPSLPSSFGPLTKRAQCVLALAQAEAHRLNHNYIGTEHLLLGVLREGEGMGARMLNEAGCELEPMRQSIGNRIGLGATDETVHGEMPMTPRLKHALQCGLDEAKALEHSFVGTEHLVLGLLAEGEGVAGRLLSEAGMDLSAARTRVREMCAS